VKECYSKLPWINTVVLLNGLIIKTNLISMDFIDFRKRNNFIVLVYCQVNITFKCCGKFNSTFYWKFTVRFYP